MGFSCLVCHEPFNAVLMAPPGSNRGAGDGRVERTTSATRCGHLFHTDCLKKAFAATHQGNDNAWTKKNCPYCKDELSAHDIWKVRASPIDTQTAKRMEDLSREVASLQQKLNVLNQHFRQVSENCDHIHAENEKKSREIENLAQRLQHSENVSQLNREERDRSISEVIRLKEIIITLSSRLTSTSPEDRVTTNGGTRLQPNGIRLALERQDDESLQSQDCTFTMNSGAMSQMNGPLLQPPGLPLPFHVLPESTSGKVRLTFIDHEMYNVAVCSNAIKSENYVAMGQSITTGTVTQNQTQPDMANPERYFLPPPSQEVQSVQKHSFDANNNNFVNRLQALAINTPSEEDTYTADAPNTSLNTAHNSNKKGAAGKVGSTKNPGEEAYHYEDDEFETEWHQKKGRRRGSSRSSNHGRRESMSDKKLLYGSFRCPTCKAEWGSSQSVLNKPQTCRVCKTVVQPHQQGPILSRKELELNGKMADIPRQRKKK